MVQAILKMKTRIMALSYPSLSPELGNTNGNTSQPWAAATELRHLLVPCSCGWDLTAEQAQRAHGDHVGTGMESLSISFEF